MRREDAAPPWLTVALLFFSGLCALVCQVGWLRELRLVFGASTLASAAVLAIFMGGLGAGAVLLGRRADCHPQPLRLYGLLELGIAVGTLASPFLFALVRRAYLAQGGSFALGEAPAFVVRLLLAAAVLALPTFLMGGTLPVAVKALPRGGSRRSVALLYGVNTLGGVCGVLLATFLLLEAAGIRGMLFASAALSAALGVVALSVAARRRVAEAGTGLAPAAAPAGEPHAVETDKRVPGAPGRALLCAVACVLGFSFFLMELVWYRMLSPLLGGTTYTFGFILAAALCGIGAGGLAQHLLDPRMGRSLRLLATTCGLQALGVALAYGLGDRVAVVAALLRPEGAAGLPHHIVGWAAVCAMTLLPASLIAGYQLPLIIALLGRGSAGLGGDTGAIYAWNTAGAIAGSLAGGFILLPALGAPACWRLAALLPAAACAALLAASLAREGRHPLPAFAAVFALGAAALLSAEGPSAAWRHSPIAVHGAALRGRSANEVRNWVNGRRFNVIWERDGVESGIALGRSDGLDLVVNGKSDGNARSDAGTQVMAPLIPALLHPAPRRGLVIGLGTGTSAGWLAAVDTVERVDVVELEPAVLEVARRCAPVSRDALTNPRVRVIIGDGREWVMTTRERYDIVMSEPSNPYRAGIASLYTREFYTAVARQLAPGGIFAQWVQGYEVDEGTVRLVRGTLASVFADVQTWRTTHGDLLFTASGATPALSVPRLRARLATEPFRSAVRAGWGVVGLEGFLGSYIAGDEAAREDAARGSFNTDDRMLAEFGFARGIEGDLFAMDAIQGSARQARVHRPEVRDGGVDWALVDRSALMQLAWQNDSAWASPGGDAVLGAYEAWVEGSLGAVARIAESGLWRATEPLESVMLAEALAELGDDRARPLLDAVRREWPASAAAIEARLLLRRGDAAGALRPLGEAFAGFRRSPWDPRPVMRRTLLLAEELAALDAAFARQAFDLLLEPFSVRILDARRISSLVVIARGLDPARGVQALAQVEPDVFWQEEFLRFRLDRYERAGSPRVAQARRDLEEFLQAR